MKRSKTISKYNIDKLEGSAPICPICGKHTITIEKEPTQYKLDGEIITLNEEFFRCHEDGGIYATPEMVQRNTNQLRTYIWQKELDKKKLSPFGFKRDTHINPEEVYQKQRLDRSDIVGSDYISAMDIVNEVLDQGTKNTPHIMAEMP